MSNLDLINAYFGNEMTAMERQEFEENLQKDAELKKEFDFQKEIIHAVKESRKAQLKAMLNNVPVSGGTAGGAASFGKTASVIATIGLAALGVYFLWPDESENDIPAQDETTIVMPEDKGTESAPSPKIEEQLPEKAETDVKEEADPKIEEYIPEENTQQPADEDIALTPEINTPDIVPSFDTSDDLNDSLEAPGNKLSAEIYDNNSSLDVEINSDHKKYNFHYQFTNSKLFLFGAFDQGLYEILEINEQDNKTLFLYYKNKFYYLRTDQTKILPLEPVQKESLIKRLENTRVQD